MATQIKNIFLTWSKWKRRIFILITHGTQVYSICLALSTEFFILKTILTFFFFLWLLLYNNYYYYYHLSIHLFNLFVYLFIYFSIYLFAYVFCICLKWHQNMRPVIFFLFNCLCTCVHSIFINHHPSFLISSFIFHPFNFVLPLGENSRHWVRAAWSTPTRPLYG